MKITISFKTINQVQQDFPLRKNKELKLWEHSNKTVFFTAIKINKMSFAKKVIKHFNYNSFLLYGYIGYLSNLQFQFS